MFQYAFSRELAAMYGEEVAYNLDSYNNESERKLAINCLNVPMLVDWKAVISEEERNNIIQEQKVYRVLQRIMRALHRSDRVGETLYKRYLQKGRYYNFDPYFYSLPKLNKKNKYAYGYFQGEPYFQHVIEEIRKAFIISTPVGDESDKLKEISSCNAVCVHIREGDYKEFKNKRFNVLTPGYFQRGIEYIKTRVKNPVFFVFTNDLQAVKKNYNLKEVQFINGYKDYQDLRLMQACKHFVISNSTFSWWASYLANYSGKIIVVPRKWRNNQEAEPALMTSKSIEYVRL